MERRGGGGLLVIHSVALRFLRQSHRPLCAEPRATRGDVRAGPDPNTPLPPPIPSRDPFSLVPGPNTGGVSRGGGGQKSSVCGALLIFPKAFRGHTSRGYTPPHSQGWGQTAGDCAGPTFYDCGYC